VLLVREKKAWHSGRRDIKGGMGGGYRGVVRRREKSGRGSKIERQMSFRENLNEEFRGEWRNRSCFSERNPERRERGFVGPKGVRY